MQYNRFASLYDMFMDNVDYDMWASYIASFLKPGVRVLECGCGTGEISIRLSRLGFEVIGSDISDDMLSVASEKARGLGLRIPLLHMDMRNFDFPKPFDAIISPCDCVNYLTSISEVEGFFKSVFASLKSGGVFIFDISSQYKLSKILGMNTFSDSRRDAVYVWKNNYDEESRLIEMQLEFFTKAAVSKAGKPLYERFGERHIQRAHSQEELCALLNRIGLSIIGVYADFSNKAPGETTERIQFITKKSE